MPTDPKRNKKRTLRIVGTALEDALLYLAKVTCAPEGDVIQHLMKVRPGYGNTTGPSKFTMARPISAPYSS